MTRTRTITIPAHYVRAWERTWECSGLPDADIWAEFEDNGDVVFRSPNCRNLASGVFSAIFDEYRVWLATLDRMTEIQAGRSMTS